MDKKRVRQEKPNSPVCVARLTVKELNAARQAFEALKSLRIKSGSGIKRIGKLVSVLSIEYREIDESLNKLIEHIGERKPNGGGYWIDPDDVEKRQEFDDAYQDLTRESVEIRFRPLRAQDFGQNVDVPLNIFADMHWFFDFEEEEFQDEGPAEEPAGEAEGSPQQTE